MFKALFGGKKADGKSVAEVRGRGRGQVKDKSAESPADDRDARIRQKRARNMVLAEAKAAREAAVAFRPDINGAVEAARAITGGPVTENWAAIDRAVRLTGADRLISETLSDGTRRYLALAAVRALLEEPAEDDPGPQPKPRLRR